MKIDKEQGNEILRLVVWGISGVLAMVLAMVLGGCTSVRYVPVETVRHDSIRIVNQKVDSVYVHDSVATFIKGDTVIRDKYKYIYKYLMLKDTCYVNKTDSVQVPYPVEKQLTRWQKAKIELGGWAFGGILFSLIIVCWLVYKRRNK